jgi:hypothetical protein
MGHGAWGKTAGNWQQAAGSYENEALDTKKRESESRIQNEKSKSKYFFSILYCLLTTDY